MSDVVLSTTESVTTVTVVDDVVQVAVTTNPVEVSSSTAGVQGATGAQGVGYNNVSSTSSIPVTLGLHTWTVANVGAFLPGMRIRAIHTDTPTIWLEGFANVASGTTIIITADKLSGSGTHNTWKFASAGEIGATGATGATGAQGASGVISVTSPVTNSGSASSAVLGLDQTALSLTRSQITDFTSGTVTSASTAQQAGTAVYATTSGTATYATTSGTAVFATNASTAVTISGSITQSQVTNLTTDLANTAKLNTANTFSVGGHVINNSGTAIVPLQINGVSGQSGDLVQVRDNSGNNNLSISATYGLVGRNAGTLAFALSSASGIGAFYSTAAGNTPMLLRGASGQTADLLKVQNNSGTDFLTVNNVGSLLFGTGSGSFLSGANGRVNVQLSGDNIGVTVRGFTSQTANLLQLQASTGTVVGGFTAPVNNVSRLNLGGTDLGATLGVNLHASGGVGQVIRGAASQTANLQEWQNSAGTILSRIDSGGNFTASNNAAAINSGTFLLGSRNSGAELTMVRQNAASTNPGANLARLYFRDGTNAGTLKLVVRAGAAGAEETLFDNLDQTGTSTIAIGSGVRATDATVATASTGVGYMGLPQNTTTTGAYTIVAADAGKHVYASATRTVTIPANSALALPIGTTLTFIAGAGATMTIAITTDTMYLAGAGTTGSRTLAAHGIATAVKTTATTWIISGNGLT